MTFHKISVNHIHIQTHRQTFPRNSQTMFKTSRNVQIHQKLDIENSSKAILFYIYTDESKNSSGLEE